MIIDERLCNISIAILTLGVSEISLACATLAKHTLFWHVCNCLVLYSVGTHLLLFAWCDAYFSLGAYLVNNACKGQFCLLVNYLCKEHSFPSLLDTFLLFLLLAYLKSLRETTEYYFFNFLSYFSNIYSYSFTKAQSLTPMQLLPVYLLG